MGFTRAELESFRDAEVDDLVGPGLRLLFVGINPGLWTAATQTHFAHPGNRFYPALLRGGVIEREIDRGSGMTDDDRRHLIERGIGITNVVRRATAKASELSAEEYRRGGEELRARVRELDPAVVAVAGVTAYRTAFRSPKAPASVAVTVPEYRPPTMPATISGSGQARTSSRHFSPRVNTSLLRGASSGLSVARTMISPV